MLKLLEINEMSPSEIRDQIKKSSVELVDLRMKFASRQLEDVSQVKKKRKEIARLLTVETQKLNEKGNEGLKSKQTKKVVKSDKEEPKLAKKRKDKASS